jgi:predicted Zn-dependent protease
LTLSKVFSTHPLTDDRIKQSQKNIQEYLKAKPEYVVSTSEFDNVKSRLMALNNRRKVDDGDANKPRLRKKPGAGTTIEDEKDKKGSDKDAKTDEDERPTLKRRPN